MGISPWPADPGPKAKILEWIVRGSCPPASWKVWVLQLKYTVHSNGISLSGQFQGLRSDHFKAKQLGSTSKPISRVKLPFLAVGIVVSDPPGTWLSIGMQDCYSPWRRIICQNWPFVIKTTNGRSTTNKLLPFCKRLYVPPQHAEVTSCCARLHGFPGLVPPSQMLPRSSGSSSHGRPW